MFRTRFILTFLATCLTLVAAARGDEEADRRRQVEAARIAAQVKVVGLIADEPLARGYTVGAFLDRMNARHRLWQAVAAGQQVGGVRWIDDGTCQVRVDVRASHVGQVLLDVALASPNQSPISYDAIEQRVDQWIARSFSATAGSLSAERAAQVAPPRHRDEWAGVDDQQRRSMINTARRNAGMKLVEQYSQDQSIDDAARSRLIDWASSQPVTGVQFRTDRAVDVTIAYDARDLISVLREAIPGFEALAGDSPPTVTGSSKADADVPGRQVVVIPTQPPGWADDLIDVIAEASFKASALKTARLADAAAQQALRDKLGALRLDDESTLAEQAAVDPSVAAALDRAVSASRVAKVDYRADGSVAVRLVVPGKTVWQELTSGR